MSKQRDRDEFIYIMTLEYPRSDLLPILRSILRLAKQHGRLQEDACNISVDDGHDDKCEKRIRTLCGQLNGCRPVFSGDPRGCTVKLQVPSGRTNDWGNIGICVPQ